MDGCKFAMHVMTLPKFNLFLPEDLRFRIFCAIYAVRCAKCERLLVELKPRLALRRGDVWSFERDHIVCHHGHLIKRAYDHASAAPLTGFCGIVSRDDISAFRHRCRANSAHACYENRVLNFVQHEPYQMIDDAFLCRVCVRARSEQRRAITRWVRGVC